MSLYKGLQLVASAITTSGSSTNTLYLKTLDSAFYGQTATVTCTKIDGSTVNYGSVTISATTGTATVKIKDTGTYKVSIADTSGEVFPHEQELPYMGDMMMELFRDYVQVVVSVPESDAEFLTGQTLIFTNTSTDKKFESTLTAGSSGTLTTSVKISEFGTYRVTTKASEKSAYLCDDMGSNSLTIQCLESENRTSKNLTVRYRWVQLSVTTDEEELLNKTVTVTLDNESLTTMTTSATAGTPVTKKVGVKSGFSTTNPGVFKYVCEEAEESKEQVSYFTTNDVRLSLWNNDVLYSYGKFNTNRVLTSDGYTYNSTTSIKEPTKYDDYIDIRYNSSKGDGWYGYGTSQPIDLTDYSSIAITTKTSSVAGALNVRVLNNETTKDIANSTIQENIMSSSDITTLIVDISSIVGLRNIFIGNNASSSVGRWGEIYEIRLISNGLVPTMTSDTTPSGQVIASSYMSDGSTNCYGWKVFDGVASSSNRWISNTSTDSYVGYKFTEQKCVKAISYTIANSRQPKNCIIQGSNNNTDWTDIHSFVGEKATVEGSAYVIDFNNNTSYQYYRLFITDCWDTSSSQPAIWEMQFYGN